MKPETIAEIEGEYGPVTISERLVQKIWARGEFRRTDLRTREGATLEIVDLGKWNLLGGPDFKDVAILVDGVSYRGDAELHFFESDWESHGHETNPDFRNVILHIVVFPGKGRRRLRCSVRHSLLFLDLLPQGLECFAEEEALGALSAGKESVMEEALLSLPVSDRLSLLVEKARKRYEGKVRHARGRIDLLGWDEACHQTAMEILGYRYNRSAMLFVAGSYTVGALRSGKYTAGELFEAGMGRWRLSGTRPANQPRQRLRQYLDWVARRPEWPALLAALPGHFPEFDQEGVMELSRKTLNVQAIRSQISEKVLADTVGGTRLENLVCDGFLPLVAALSGKPLFPFWFYWFPGDVPSALKQVVQRVTAGVSRSPPLCNGYLQGVMQRMLEIITRER